MSNYAWVGKGCEWAIRSIGCYVNKFLFRDEIQLFVSFFVITSANFVWGFSLFHLLSFLLCFTGWLSCVFHDRAAILICLNAW